MAVATLRRRARVRPAHVGVALGVVGLNAVAAVAALHHPIEVIALALAIPALVALLQRPQRGILMLVIGAPLSGLLVFVPHSGLVEGWKQFVVLLMLAGTFLGPPESPSLKARPRPSWVIGLVPLLAMGALSGIAVGPARAFFGLRQYFFYLLAAWAIWRRPPNGKERDHIVTALMVVGVLEGFYALFQQYIGPERLHQLGYAYNDTITFIGPRMRSFGTFQQPFGFAFFEMIVLLIAIPHVLAEPSRPRSRWFLLFAPICLLGWAAAVIRGAILGLAVGIAYLGVGRYRVLLLTIPAALVVVLLLPSRLVAPALSSSSSQQRVSGWSENVRSLTLHPFGIGVGATGSAAVKVRAETEGASTEATAGDSTYEPDNSWFKILLELGVLALWFFVLVVTAICSSTHQAAKKLDGVDAAFARGVTAMVLAAMAAAFVSSYFDIFPMDLFFWMFVAVVACMTEEEATPIARAA